MASQRYRLDTDVSGRKVFVAFLFGAGIGGAMIYPTLPTSIQVVSMDTDTFAMGPVGGPLLIGVAMFAFFFLGMFLLNLLFMETSR